MREILFRAKRIDYDKFPKKEWWIEGNAFVHDDGRTVDISTGTEKFSINKRVNPETLCQYTGLKDKNGNRIWENDIVEDKRFNGFYKIVFRVRDGGWYVENINSGALFRIIERTSCQYERCGNIFDNPELLKGRTDMQELEKAIDMLDKLSFFGGQRAGRELWNDKPRDVQDEDIANFNRDIEYLRDFIRKHMNDGWISVDERMPTQEECEDNWFWIAYGDSFGNSPRIAKCEWVSADDEDGNDDSGPEFYIDQFPLPYKPSKNLIKAWKIIDIPAPYRPERNGT